MDVVQFLPLLFTPPAGGESGGGGVTLITFGLVFVVFYFLIIRPQSKRQKHTKNMLAQLKKGDKVVTIGGIRGVVKSLTTDSVVINVSGDNTLELNRGAISSVVGDTPKIEKAPKEKTGKTAKTDKKSE